MIKTVKVKKSFRLDELLKYVWDNSVTEKRVFMGNHGQRVVFDNVGGFYPSGYAYSPDTTFTVEVEEEVTEDTVFDTLVDVNNNDEVHTTRNVSIGLYAKEQTKEIHAIVNGKLQRIWEAE